MTLFGIPAVWIGSFAACLTTLCWLPQVIKLIRERETHAISLQANLLFWLGTFSWLCYGIAIHDWPVMLANGTTLGLTTLIIGMKLRYG
jgi:MtN3 and saliva related transmembrane protein